ncbi:MAG: hypothetical protein HYZ11_13710 [Candidatus Tectomicrobia bacterium]|uniref:Uncharacterized protein n=1 Tax=Tectimicrobiota bacterium TaxID=2528274 RepID=A0A932HZM0_UNCTE|nr:hypothetical protein [Candidatus Tectomicrobia bacterium]
MARAREMAGDVAAGVAVFLLVLSMALSMIGLYYKVPRMRGGLFVAAAGAAERAAGISARGDCPGQALPREPGRRPGTGGGPAIHQTRGEF